MPIPRAAEADGPCGTCGHALSRHNNSYCTRCDCTARRRFPRCSCGDEWDWQCKFHGMNDG